MAENESEIPKTEGFLTTLFSEIVHSPLNIALVCLIGVLVYKIVKNRQDVPVVQQPEPELPKMEKRDFTVEELKKYDGTGEDGRLLVAVNGNVFDVTKGKQFYGPGGPYAAFGGRDASRALGKFSLEDMPDEYDDLSDLNTMEMDSVREWEAQFKEKYDLVGKLLKPGEQPTNYSDDEEDETPTGAGDKKDD